MIMIIWNMKINMKSIEINNKDFQINLSDKAIEIISKAIKSRERINKILRISLAGSGCSGFKYGLNFVNIVEENDITCDYSNDIKIIIDINSYSCMKNTYIDYVSTSEGSGFTFNNPSSMKACGGCG